MLIAEFSHKGEEIEIDDELWQHDYGQKIQIKGLDLPEVFEVHFAWKDIEKAKVVTGSTVDGVSVVDIPNIALEQRRAITAYIYLSNAVEGETVNTILMTVNKRKAPEGFEIPEKIDLFHHTIEATAEYQRQAKESEENASAQAADAEAWAHGREDHPDQEQDNAKYYAEQAAASQQMVSDSVTQAQNDIGEAQQQAIKTITEQQGISIQKIKNQTAESEDNLKNTIRVAEQIKTDLDTEVENATPIKQGLDDSNTAAIKTKVDLDKSNTIADQIKAELEVLNTTASKTKTNLDGANKTATDLTGTLENEISEGIQTKIDIQTTGETAMSNLQAEATKQQEFIKTSIDDTLSIPGKAADAAVTGKKIDSLKEDLESYARIANYTSLTPVFEKKGLYWSCNTDYKLGVLYANEYKFAKAYEVHKGKRYMVCGMSNGTNTSPLVIFSKSYPSEQNKTAPFESFIVGSNSGNSVVTEKHIISPIDGYMLITISTVHGGYAYEENSNLVADDRYGVYVSNGCYTTFSKIGSNMYLCRVFKNVYINQLFDFNACYIGKFDEYGELYKYKDFGTFPSDVVGPIAIRENSWSATTKFSGGSHGININGTEYPTAKQKFLLVKCGEKTVDADGYYMGRTEFLSTNALYIPMTITGNDLSSAKEGIEEIRHYCIDDVLSVSVDYNILTDIIADVLYGLQLQIYGMEKVTLPNNEVKVSIDQEQNYIFEKPENKYICTNESGEYCSVEMSTCGLGDFSKNNGESDTKYGYISVFKKPNKIYFQLINHGIQLASGKTLHWDVVCDHKPH